MKLNKAFKFRLLPNQEQINLLAKTFGCCRFIKWVAVCSPQPTNNIFKGGFAIWQEQRYITKICQRSGKS